MKYFYNPIKMSTVLWRFLKLVVKGHIQLDNIVMADISLTNRGYEGELTIPLRMLKVTP